jgi:hypothetical protein
VDKDHGRIVTRKLWCVSTDPKTMGLAGVAQVVRIHCNAQLVRHSKVIKQPAEVRLCSDFLLAQEARPEGLGRDHWSIEKAVLSPGSHSR